MKYVVRELLCIEAKEWAAVFDRLSNGRQLADRLSAVIRETMALCSDRSVGVPRGDDPRTVGELVEREAVEWGICLAVVRDGAELAACFAQMIRTQMATAE